RPAEDPRRWDDPPHDQAPVHPFAPLAAACDSDRVLLFPAVPPPDVVPTSPSPSFSFSVPGNCINSENTSEPSLTHVDVRHDDLVDLVGKSLSIEEFVDRI